MGWKLDREQQHSGCGNGNWRKLILAVPTVRFVGKRDLNYQVASLDYLGKYQVLLPCSTIP
jgi:hypothetical protein